MNSDQDPGLPCPYAYLASGALGVFYVGSLYVWKTKGPSKEYSALIRRCISVSVVSILSPLYVSFFISPQLLEKNSLWNILGLRTEGLCLATIIPLFLTFILFLGPLTMLLIDNYEDLSECLYPKLNILWFRNYVVAPFTEEIVFRSCASALIIHCTKPLTAVFVCPLFFGAAHFHHMIERIRFGTPVKNAVLSSCFQFLYTTIFGSYSAYLFLRTGHLIAPVLAHCFCNAMGFPDFNRLLELPRYQRITCSICFVAGLILWYFLLTYFTEPSLYQNQLPWAKDI